MNERKNKSVFIDTIKKEIENRNFLREFLNTTYQDVLKAFDGKVYNKRFEKALFAELQKVSPLASCNCEIQSPCMYSNFSKNNTVEVEIKIRNEEYNYNNYESIYTKIVLVHDDNYNLRIDSEKSNTEKYTLSWAASFDKETEERKTILTDYDKYLQIANQMETAVKLYNSLPSKFRGNMNTNYLNIY